MAPDMTANQNEPTTDRGQARQPEGRPERRRIPRSFEFMGARFDRVSPDQVFARVFEAPADHRFRYIITPNVDHLVNLRRSPELLAPIYNDAWLTVCDSKILESLGQSAGLPIWATPGSDITQRILEDGVIGPGDAVTVIGGAPDMIAELKRRYGLETIHHHNPPMGLRHKPEAIAACARFVAENPARFVFICVGAPQGEMVAKACFDRGDCTGLGLCVGASLEFLTGLQSRAPAWMRSAKLEWLHRLASNPKRMWKRYLVDGPTIFRDYWRWRREAKRAKG